MPRVPKILFLLMARMVLTRTDREIMRGVAKYSQLHSSWSIILEPPFYMTLKRDMSLLALLNKHKPDGIIAKLNDEVQAQKLISTGLPLIYSVCATKDPKLIPSGYHLIGDPVAIGKMGAEHLLNRGFRRFAYCGYDEAYSKMRWEAYQKTVIKAGFEAKVYKPLQSEAKLSWERQRKRLADWIHSLEKPVGIMTVNDFRGQQMLEACKIVGLHVPEEVAVVSTGNENFICSITDPPLSSIDFSYQKAGYDAAALLDRLIAGEKIKPLTITIPAVRVKVRRSTDIVAVEDTQLAEAIRFIHQHAGEAIQVDDVVNAVTLSRSHLERRFCQIFGRSLHTEIINVRVKKVAQMLTETNLTISQVASTLQYPGAAQLSRQFKHVKKISPSKYREQYDNR